MKKPVKIILVVALIAIGIYAARLAYGFLILSVVTSDAVSSEVHLEFAQALYEKCKEKGQDDCEYYLAQDLLDVFSKQRKESMAVVFDNTKTEAERIDALKTFYELSRAGENKPIDKDEALFYDAVAFNQNNPVELKRIAFGYILQSPIDDPVIVQTLMEVADYKYNVPVEWRKNAIKSLGQAGVKEAADIFIQALEDENWEVRLSAENAMAQIGARDKGQVLQLLNIAVDETKGVIARESALSALESLFRSSAIEDFNYIDMLESLLEDDNYVIRSATADALRVLTGKKYTFNEEEGEDIDKFIEDAYGLIID
ncbi:HEAT repeat domain-containing protein [Patescibacteria group bacterium AH-259-L05]|nr:HEAT repeat domain-containing protein [Patescibacteria group bacterium AH-259-L05]